MLIKPASGKREMDEQRLHAARVTALFTLARPAYFVAVALGGILLPALWMPYSAALLVGWFVTLGAVTLARVALHWRFARAADAARDPLLWENRFAVGAFASGAVWAFAGIVFFPEADPIQQVAVVMVIGGVIVGAAALYAPSAKALYAFSSLPLVAVILQLLARGHITYHLLALAMAMFGVVMGRMAHFIRRDMRETVAANMRNRDLVERAAASERQLRDAIASFPEGIAIFNEEDRLVVCNELYARLHGAGQSAAALVDMPLGRLAGTRHSKAQDDASVQYQADDGRWLQASARRMNGGGWVGLVSDISALKRAQESYLQVLAEEHLVLDTLPVGLAFVEQRVIVRCNRRLEQMLGYGAGELTGKSTRVIYPSEEAWHTAGEAYSTLSGGKILEGDVPLRKKDGADLWCRLLTRALNPESPQESAIVAFSDFADRHAAESALKKSELMYRNLVETSSELIWSLDRDGRWTYLNAAGARRVYGHEPGEMLGRRFTEVVARELQERDHAVFQGVLAGRTVFSHETRHARRDGSYVELSFNAIALRDAAGEIVGATGTARDITEEKRARVALHESVAKLRLAVDTADLYYWEWDADSDRLRWGRDPGLLPRVDGAERTWSEYAQVVHADDRERYRTACRAAAERLEVFEIEFRVVLPDGRIPWYASRGVPLRDGADGCSRVIGVTQEITERKLREEAVRFLAYHDSLTGLPNRRLLDDRLTQAVHQAQRRDSKVAVMLVDLDSFKQVNDSAGHRAGDTVLREVGQRLSGCVRRADTLARHGGDEFVIVISDLQQEADCQIVADKILRALAQEFRVDGSAFVLGASIGISIFPADAGTGEALLRNADAAMYRAKQQGRNLYRFYAR